MDQIDCFEGREGKIVAQRSEGVFLVYIGEFKARVLDLNQKIYFPEFNVDSILARGYWEDYNGPQDLEDKLNGVNIEK